MKRHWYSVLVALLALTIVKPLGAISPERTIFRLGQWLVVAREPRTLTFEDFFKIEAIGEVSISPNGEVVAYVRRRPRLSVGTYQHPFFLGNDRADVWLAPARGGPATNLTHGEVDGSGWWAQTWSPNGTRLAMLSTKGGDEARLWVWEKATGRLKKLSDRGIAMDVVKQFAWIDDQRLAVVVLPEGGQLSLTATMQLGTALPMREWPKQWVGREPTVSVLDSGVSANLNARAQEQLQVLEVVTGKAQTLASAALIHDLRVAPEGQHLAFLKQVKMLQPDPTKLMDYQERLGYWPTFLGERYQFVVTGTGSRLAGAEANGAKFVVPRSFRWSRDGRSYAFIGVKDGGDDAGPFQVFRGDMDGSIQVVPLSDCDPRGLVWASGNRLLVSAECNVSSADFAAKKRKEWWLAEPKAAPRNMTERLKTSPNDLVADQAGKVFVGVANGDVWRVSIDSGEWKNLTEAFGLKVAGIAWPNKSASREAGAARIVVSVPHGQLTDYYRIDVLSGSVKEIARPSDLAELVAYRPEADVALFRAEESTGTYLTLVQGEERRPLVETNKFLHDVAEGALRMIEYRGMDGQNLRAWLLLPPHYQSGTRYPMVTWVYAGSTAGDIPEFLTRLNNEDPLNLQFLAARGYVVLLPSMPLKPSPDGKNQLGSDPYMELAKGVIPAVDKVVEMGIADPRRLAVMGHSFGGYSTYGLVTQTNRFQAAIAFAGESDLISMYGIFDPRSRYGPYPQEEYFAQSIIESGQGRMGNPLWKDLGRYVRNSPLFYVDRVQTPLMIVQGDMDIVPIQQGEEFFTALNRQGKRARFVRYWGEEHTLMSPANIRDFWTQVYAWLDEFCDITRDAEGNLVFDGDHVKSRNGGPALNPEDFLRFDKVTSK